MPCKANFNSFWEARTAGREDCNDPKLTQFIRRCMVRCVETFWSFFDKVHIGKCVSEVLYMRQRLNFVISGFRFPNTNFYIKSACSGVLDKLQFLSN